MACVAPGWPAKGERKTGPRKYASVVWVTVAAARSDVEDENEIAAAEETRMGAPGQEAQTWTRLSARSSEVRAGEPRMTGSVSAAAHELTRRSAPL
jgi:hypothetical protein